MSDAPGLTDEQRAALAEAAARLKKVLRPARVARVNAWTVGAFGALSVLFALVNGGSGLAIGIALVAVAWNEFRGITRLRALDPAGARILGWNQLILAAVIVAYCAFQIAHVGTDPTLAAALEADSSIASTIADLTRFVYGTVAVIVAGVQLLFARYHFRSRERVEAFVRETPEWVRETLTRLP